MMNRPYYVHPFVITGMPVERFYYTSAVASVSNAFRVSAGKKVLEIVHWQIPLISTALRLFPFYRAFLIYLSGADPTDRPKKMIIIFEPDVNFHERVNLCFWSFSTKKAVLRGEEGRREASKMKEGVQFSLLLFDQFSVFYGRQWLIRIDRARRVSWYCDVEGGEGLFLLVGGGNDWPDDITLRYSSFEHSFKLIVEFFFFS